MNLIDLGGTEKNPICMFYGWATLIIGALLNMDSLLEQG